MRVTIPLIVLGYPDIEASGVILDSIYESGIKEVVLYIPYSCSFEPLDPLRSLLVKTAAKGIKLEEYMSLLLETKKETELDLKLILPGALFYFYPREIILEQLRELQLQTLFLTDISIETLQDIVPHCVSFFKLGYKGGFLDKYDLKRLRKLGFRCYMVDCTNCKIGRYIKKFDLYTYVTSAHLISSSMKGKIVDTSLILELPNYLTRSNIRTFVTSKVVAYSGS